MSVEKRIKKTKDNFVSAEAARFYTEKSYLFIEEISDEISIAATNGFSTIEYSLENIDEVVIDQLQEILIEKGFHFTLEGPKNSKKPKSIIISW